ncbi:hypothetical protein PMAYCL1PPCAC_32651 [Pristionchus mayeri]|uniref:Uncharacterized protein n=1 Tax=Pristionchus mayeri TaxID=1317129 RepID=A0AAN5IDL8_9BILA|nr:hypothetical protein PMAYCL1PPCAC_32651 [Pristionchus mayeri]
MDDLLVGPSKLGMGYPVIAFLLFKSWSCFQPMQVCIKEKVRVDFSKFDYGRKKLWMFQDIVYSIEFIKALPIYCLLDDCSKRVLAASALACTNFTAAYYSYTHNSDKTYYPDGYTMTWDRNMSV